jgi:hypothetical protein
MHAHRMAGHGWTRYGDGPAGTIGPYLVPSMVSSARGRLTLSPAEPRPSGAFEDSGYWGVVRGSTLGWSVLATITSGNWTVSRRRFGLVRMRHAAGSQRRAQRGGLNVCQVSGC